MQRSWLVQRLKQPCKQPMGMINPFSFGGGSGGFGEEAQRILSTVCNFDYMGAAEFEDGIVARTFHAMVQRTPPDICFNFSLPTTNKKMALITMDIIVICPADWKEEVRKRITTWAIDEKEDYDGLEEPTNLRYILADKGGRFPPVGWFELDNGFMFFTDPMMAESFYKLLTQEISAK